MLQDIVSRRWAGRPLLAAGALFLSTIPLAAQVQIFPSDAQWTVSPAFDTHVQAHKNISGAACTEIGGRGCIAVNDVTNLAQIFTKSGTLIRPADIIKLQPDQVEHRVFTSVDAEGAGFDGEHFYIIGSHALASPISDPPPFFLAFRIKVIHTRPPTSGTVPVERSERVREAITAAILTGAFGPVQLQQISAEGIAVKDGRMFIGFRAPLLGGSALLMSLDAEAVFATGPNPPNLNADVKKLTLGNGHGIRDLALGATGLLILSGPVTDTAAAPSLFQFDLPNGPLRQLGTVVSPTDRKAETLLLLQDDPEFVRFLVMFDGVDNGGPIEYFVSR
jgi:hypothetical protein